MPPPHPYRCPCTAHLYSNNKSKTNAIRYQRQSFNFKCLDRRGRLFLRYNWFGQGFKYTSSKHGKKGKVFSEKIIWQRSVSFEKETRKGKCSGERTCVSSELVHVGLGTMRFKALYWKEIIAIWVFANDENRTAVSWCRLVAPGHKNSVPSRLGNCPEKWNICY